MLDVIALFVLKDWQCCWFYSMLFTVSKNRACQRKFSGAEKVIKFGHRGQRSSEVPITFLSHPLVYPFLC